MKVSQTTMLLGAASGTVSAGAVFLPLGEMPGVAVSGVCIGLRLFDGCDGFALAVYLLPGLIFGAAFGERFRRQGSLRPGGAVAFAMLAMLANAAAVATGLAARDVLDASLDRALRLAAAGAMAGAVGGALLAGGASLLVPLTRRRWPVAAGAGLGLLLPLWEWSVPSMVLFYILWQGGYGAALSAARRN